MNKSELDAELRQRAELSYDSGVTDAKKLDRAVKLKKKLDTQNLMEQEMLKTMALTMTRL